MKRVLFPLVCCLLVWGCHDDAVESSCDPACEAPEVCQLGVCKNPSLACDPACESPSTCQWGQCYNPGNGCNPTCETPEVCQLGACFNPGEGCDPACQSPDVCQLGKCIDANKACDPACKPPNVCQMGKCVAPADVCEPACISPKTCEQGVCVAPLGRCEDTCKSPNYCQNGVCLDCEKPCDSACCLGNTLCDVMNVACAAPCEDGSAMCGGLCCEADFTCDASFGCVPVCGTDETRCGDGYITPIVCCNSGEVCSYNLCVEDCGDRVECNGNCCEEGGICVDGVCRGKCEGIRCGTSQELCCDDVEQICLFQTCLARGKSCTDGNDCAYDEYCDDSTLTCVNVDADPNACIARPIVGEFKPMLKWHWPGESMCELDSDGKPIIIKNAQGNGACLPKLLPEYNQVMRIPIIINLTDDNGDGKIDENDVPDLVFNAFSSVAGNGGYNGRTALRVIDGKTGRDIAVADTVDYINGNPAAAKVNDDEYPEIVVGTNATVKKTRILNLLPKDDKNGHELVVIAELDGASVNHQFINFDGGKYPEIVTNIGIIKYDEDADQEKEPKEPFYVWKCKGSFGDFSVADIDGDGEAEIIGTRIWDKDCKIISSDTVSASRSIFADMDLSEDTSDGKLSPEQVVMIGGGAGSAATGPTPPPGKVLVYELFKTTDADGVISFSRKLLWSADMPIDYDYVTVRTGYNCKAVLTDVNQEKNRRARCATGGGPLVIADFNGDEKPDIGIATRWSYVVFTNVGDVLWADFTTQDDSSAATGSSVFDFEGDGIAEVLYADERNLHVYKGPGSDELGTGGFRTPERLITPAPLNSSGTLDEYPIVVDVDNDGHSEIVVVSNDYAFKGFTGIRAFEDPAGHWVRTRRIWNQFNYHVTNINEDGTVPKRQVANWTRKNLNSFRQNIQPDGLFKAPNLVANSLTHTGCKVIELQADFENSGSYGVSGGLFVGFYVKDVNGTGIDGYIGASEVLQSIPPGMTGSVQYTWDGKTVVFNGESVEITLPASVYFVVDVATADRPHGHYLECKEDDNSSAAVKIAACIN